MITVTKLLLQGLLIEDATCILRLIILELLVLFYKLFVIVVELVQLRHMGLFCHAPLGFDHLVLLEISKVLQRLYGKDLERKRAKYYL
jgi:hypothetical protein